MTRMHARGLRGAALLLALLGLSAAAAAQGNSRPQADVVENGVVAIRMPKLNGRPLFDRRGDVAEMESLRWLRAQQVKADPTILQNVQMAKTSALMFLPLSSLDRFFECQNKNTTCAKAYAGSTVHQRVSDGAVIGSLRFKGNEFESERLFQEFAQVYASRIAAAAAPLPQEAYIAINIQLKPYSAADGGYGFAKSGLFSSGGGFDISLERGFCAPNTTVFPTVLGLNRADAEELANRVDAARPKNSASTGFRMVTLVLRVKINELGPRSQQCPWNLEPLALDVYPINSLAGPLVADLPLESATPPVVKSAPPLKAERAAKPPLAVALPQQQQQPAAAAPPAAAPPPPAPTVQAPKPAAGSAQGAVGNLTNLPRREAPPQGLGPDIVGIRLGMPMDQAEKIASDHLKPDLAYDLGAAGPSTGYPKGRALVSLKLGEALFIYTGDATPGKVSGVERAVIADNVDVRQVQEQYRARYMAKGGFPGLGKSTGSECSVAFNSRATKPTMKLTSGKAPDGPEPSRALARLVDAGRRLHAHPLAMGGDRSSCGPGIYLSTGSSSNPMLLFTIWDHSKASFDPEPPKRALKL